jgi:transcriptional regulator with XRE-family HTH domain
MYTKRIETCAQRIKIALKIRGMKQIDLCNLAKVPESSMSLYLKGAYEPKQDRVYNMARVLNVDEAWLMGYDVPMEREQSKVSPLDEPKLTEGEKMLLDLFRQIPDDAQKMYLEVLRASLKNQS